jgi:transcriptional regulator with XRE-family HTH domain
MRLGSIIRRWRLAADLPVRDVAAQIGIAPSTLVHMEMGKIPPHSETLIKVVSWLLSEETTNGTGKDQRAVDSVGQESGGKTDVGGE